MGAGVTVVRGDWSDPGVLDSCLDGVDAVLLVWPFLTAEAAPPVVNSVARHARQIVFLSSMGLRDDLAEQLDPINQFHAGIEHLIKKSGLEWTFLRSHTFAAYVPGVGDRPRRCVPSLMIAISEEVVITGFAMRRQR